MTNCFGDSDTQVIQPMFLFLNPAHRLISDVTIGKAGGQIERPCRTSYAPV